MKKTRLFIIEIVFLLLDFVIAYLMLRLWFWLFVNKTILTILVVLTLFALAKQVWGKIAKLGIEKNNATRS